MKVKCLTPLQYFAFLFLCNLALVPSVRLLALAQQLPSDLLTGTGCERNKNLIAIVNSVPFHTEIVVGVLHALSPFAACARLYRRPNSGHDTRDLLKGLAIPTTLLPAFDNRQNPGDPECVIVPLLRGNETCASARAVSRWWLENRVDGRRSADGQSVPGLVQHFTQHDVLYFLSPEYEQAYVRHFVKRANPKAVVFMSHEPMSKPPVAWLDWHPNSYITALSQHTAKYIEGRYNYSSTVAVTPSLPFVPDTGMSCFTDAEPTLDAPARNAVLPGCLRGMAVQGMLCMKRRGYAGLFREILDCAFTKNSAWLGGRDKYVWSNADGLHVKLVGSKHHINTALNLPPDKAVNMPAALAQGAVGLYLNLPYKLFYHAIYSSYVILPRLASARYLQDRITSTIISSLATRVPLVVDRAFLDVYTLFNESTAILQGPGESLCQLYHRLVTMPQAEYMGYRQRLAALAPQLNGQLAEWFAGVVRDAASRA